VYLGNPYQSQKDGLCDYSRKVSQGNLNKNEVAQVICTSGQSYELKSHGAASKYVMAKLSQIAQVFLLLILHNIKSKGNVSLVTLELSYLLYFILTKKNVDVSRVIA